MIKGNACAVLVSILEDCYEDQKMINRLHTFQHLSVHHSVQTFVSKINTPNTI